MLGINKAFPISITSLKLKKQIFQNVNRFFSKIEFEIKILFKTDKKFATSK